MSGPCARSLCSVVTAVVVASALVAAGCKASENTSTDGGSTGADASSTRADGGGAPPDAGACTTDPLKTGLPPLFNGLSVDIYDCPILTLTAKYGEPDAMIFKAIVYVESRFKNDAVGCTGNTSCCPESAWTAAECACLGAMQSGPQCGSSSNLGLLSNGHPDLATNPNDPDWANSCFNPWVSIELGIAGIAGNRAQVKQKFPGCTEDQYTMMAIGNFNSYGSTQSCTVYNFPYDSEVVDTYNQYAAAAGWPAHPYVTN